MAVLLVILGIIAFFIVLEMLGWPPKDPPVDPEGRS